MKPSLLRSLFLVSLVSAALAAQAQVLFVNDNDNIVYNTDTVLSDLAGAGILVEVYDVVAQGGPPSLATMYDHPAVIWYCSGDGVDLGLWNAQQDLYDLASAGVPVWFIGTDMLYANFGATPVTFNVGDLPRAVMGVATYDVQSYGDDGGLGCPQLDVASEVSSDFAAELHWAFDTFWWMDGVTTNLDGVDVIYRMGPGSYALFGAPSMVRNQADGMNVMSTFFDPALIDTYEDRVRFFQETMAYMDVSTGIAAKPRVSDALQAWPDGSGGVFLGSDAPLRSMQVLGANGQVERNVALQNTTRSHIDLSGLSAGLHVITAITTDGARLVTKWVKP